MLYTQHLHTVSNHLGSRYFGVFDFADLFSQTMRGKSYRGLSADEKKNLGASFEHTVSDHLPIWVRIPRPGFAL